MTPSAARIASRQAPNLALQECQSEYITCRWTVTYPQALSRSSSLLNHRIAAC